MHIDFDIITDIILFLYKVFELFSWFSFQKIILI